MISFFALMPIKINDKNSSNFKIILTLGTDNNLTYFARLSFLLFTLLTLQACVSVPSKPIDQDATLALHQQHLQKIAQIQQFSLKGRIGVQADGKGFSGGLNWQHDSLLDVLALYSPIGGQVANIEKTADKITLTDAKGNAISATDAESLTEKTLGWKLPLAGLADWSLGRPSKNPIQDIAWNEKGFLTKLRQGGWEIQFDDYAQQQDYTLPSKIILKSEKAHLKLLIEHWQSVVN